MTTALKNLLSEKRKFFFKLRYDFVAEKYGRENIITANVYNDKAQPHIHISFIPIVADKKNDGNKLCANNFETPKSLSRFHQAFSVELERKMRHKVNILNGATVCGNQSIAQMKTQSALILSAEIALKLADKKAKKELQAIVNCKSEITSQTDEVNKK